MSGIDALRRRVDALDTPGAPRIYWVDADEANPLRLPDGPEVLAEIAAIEAADPRAHVILSIDVDGSKEAP